jgi:hypothetical protein
MVSWFYIYNVIIDLSKYYVPFLLKYIVHVLYCVSFPIRTMFSPNRVLTMDTCDYSCLNGLKTFQSIMVRNTCHGFF